MRRTLAAFAVVAAGGAWVVGVSPAPASKPVLSGQAVAAASGTDAGKADGDAPPATPADDATWLLQRPLALPLAGLLPGDLRDSFDDARGGRRHEALDIAAQRGTAVHAVDDGVVAKLFTSVPGGLTVYQFDPWGRVAYYYAHLDRYAAGLREGQAVRRCDLIGYVGSTGNASPDAPHLHLAVLALGPERRWWKGVALNPYPALSRARTTCPPARQP